MNFYSTNHQAPCVDLKRALLTGQAPDLGLYMPETIPLFHPQEFDRMRSEDYAQIAWRVLGKYSDGLFSGEELRSLCRDAYDFPVPLEPVAADRFVMRLDRGPTASFKDFAGRMMGRMFGRLHRGVQDPLIILTATSGDTGSAIAHAFHRIPNIQVMVLFPPGEVSLRQRKQMTTLGGNITAVGVEGKFDDCQALVKKAFADVELKHLTLSSANSINIGRLLPQIVYYVYASVKLTEPGRPITFVVPSGNFGDMMGAVLAKRMGVPVKRILVAVNANDEFPRFLSSGVYQKVEPSRGCLSNAMNVGHPSNLTRLVDLYGGHMDECGLLHRVPDMARMRKDLWSVSIDDEETRSAIRQAWQRHRLLLEPHGAVGWAALERYVACESGDELVVLVETAHPAKFPEEIQRLLDFHPPCPPSLSALEDRPEEYLRLPVDYPQFRELLNRKYGAA